MEFLMDPSIWAGLLTLVVLEIVLGIDNLVFIAILADKLPPKQRDKARLLGLSLALIMRLGLLSLISWMVTLTKPLFTVMDFSFSGRDLIMLFGGIFLLFNRRETSLADAVRSKQQPNCVNGWKTAIMIPATVKATPVSGWSSHRLSSLTPSFRWMR